METQGRQGDTIILYVHGMGGGGDSRIPAILNDNIDAALPVEMRGRVRIIVRT